MSKSSWSPARSLVLALAAGTVLVGCGGGDSPGGSLPTATPSISSSPAAAPSPTTITVNKSFWHSGFKGTVTTASLDDQGQVAVSIDLENLGSSVSRFPSMTVLTAGSASVEGTPAIDEDNPVPGEAKGTTIILFDVEDDFVLDQAVLTVGNPDNNQATVPFGSVGTALTLEPVSVDVSGSATTSKLTLSADGGEMRADVPDTHDEIREGHLALTIDFSIKNGSSFAGGYAFTSANLSLRLPDGTSVAPDESPIELLKPNSTLPDQSVRFEIADPPDGEYALVLVDDLTPKAKKGEITFTIG